MSLIYEEANENLKGYIEGRDYAVVQVPIKDLRFF